MFSSISERTVFLYFALRLSATVPEIARHFGINASTAVGIIGKFERTGLVTRSSVVQGGRGRPRVVYRLNIPKPVCVLLMGGTRVTGAVLDVDLQVRARQSLHYDQCPSLAVAIEWIQDLYARLKDAQGDPEAEVHPAAVALAVSAVRVAPNLVVSSILPWATGDIESEISRALGLPTAVVFPPYLVAEYQKLTPPLPYSLVYFRVDDGVSAHCLVGGHVYRGAASLAGEVGHTIIEPDGPLCGCGQRGCLETFCSGPALVQAIGAGLASGVVCEIDVEAFRSSTPRDAVELAWRAWKRGDSYVRMTMDRIFDRLGYGLGLVQNLLDPDTVVIGGYVLQGKPEWQQEVIRRAEKGILKAAVRRTTYVPSRVSLNDLLQVIGASYFYDRSFQETGADGRRRAVAVPSPAPETTVEDEEAP